MSISNEEATYGVGFLGAIALVWKMVFRGRKDLREDRADGKIEGGYAALIDRLEKTVGDQGETIQDQGNFIRELVKALDDETTSRRAVEDDNARLVRRVERLELTVRQLGGAI